MKAVNLLPPDLRGAPKSASGSKPARETPAGVGAYVVLGALAMAVAALAVFVLAGNAVKDREAKLATVKAETQNAQQRAAALKPYADFEALVNQRLTTVRSLAEARFDWERALHDLSHALPERQPDGRRQQRRRKHAARLDPGAGAVAQGLRLEPDRGGPRDVAAAEHPGRHASDPRDVGQGRDAEADPRRAGRPDAAVLRQGDAADVRS